MGAATSLAMKASLVAQKPAFHTLFPHKGSMWNRDPRPRLRPERTARAPDGNRWLLNAGATAQVTPAIKVDAAISYIDFASSSIHHDSTFYGDMPAAVTTALRGDVEGQGLVLAVGMRTQF